jgi:hypothetical protein
MQNYKELFDDARDTITHFRESQTCEWNRDPVFYLRR